MHSKSDKTDIMIKYEADEVMKKHFESLLNRYQNDLEIPMKVGKFVIDYIRFLYYKCHKINPNCGGL